MSLDESDMIEGRPASASDFDSTMRTDSVSHRTSLTSPLRQAARRASLAMAGPDQSLTNKKGGVDDATDDKGTAATGAGNAAAQVADDDSTAVQCDIVWDDNSFRVERELTWRALLVGTFLGIFFGTQNVYFGIRSGSSMGGSIVVSLCGYGVVQLMIKSGLRRSGFFTIQENVVLESAASAGQGVVFCGGYSTYLLAMSNHVAEANKHLGTETFDITYSQSLLWLLSTFMLGFFMAQPMRQALIVKKDYPWPAAKVTTLVMRSLHSSDGGQDAKEQLQFIFKVRLFPSTFLLACLLAVSVVFVCFFCLCFCFCVVFVAALRACRFRPVFAIPTTTLLTPPHFILFSRLSCFFFRACFLRHLVYLLCR